MANIQFDRQSMWYLATLQTQPGGLNLAPDSRHNTHVCASAEETILGKTVVFDMTHFSMLALLIFRILIIICSSQDVMVILLVIVVVLVIVLVVVLYKYPREMGLPP